MSMWSRLANVFRTGRLERELDEELRFHIDERVRELVASGMPREEALADAKRRFGSPLRAREQSRDIKLMPWLDALLRDVRLGERMLRKDAMVTSTAIVSLALALGGCLAAFSLVDALILRPLPVRHPDQLIYLAFPTYTTERPEADTFGDPMFTELRDAARERADLFAMSTQVMRPVRFADSGDEKESLRTQFVSGDAFDRLGVRPAVGRLFTAQDDMRPGAHPVAVLSHRFWMRRFGGDVSVVGRWVALQDREFNIVGIADPRFTGIEPGRPTDLWLPYCMGDRRSFGNFGYNWFRILGRLKDDVRLEETRSLLDARFKSIRRSKVQDIGPYGSPDLVARFVDAPLYVYSAAEGPSPLRRQFGRTLWILIAIAGLVLLIAGSNVANLFLARTAARDHEMALRVSIGAGRGRLIQQVLVESALVAIAACALGLLFAAVAAPSVVGMLAVPEDPIHLDLRTDWRLLIVAASLTLLSTAVFGLASAFRAARVEPLTALKAGSRSIARAGMMRSFVAVQVAFGLIVLFIGSLLVLSFAKLSNVNPGFEASNVLLLSLEPVKGMDRTQQRTALIHVLDRLRGVPEVQAVASAEYNTFGRTWTHQIRLPGTQHETIEATMVPVTPEFFETMRIPVVEGRTFLRRDVEVDDSSSIIVNESFVKAYFKNDPGVGRTIRGRFNDTSKQTAFEIVGVVADSRYDLREQPTPTLYIPMRLASNGTLHVRVSGDPANIIARLREEVRAANPLFRVSSITSQSAIVERTLVRERLLARLSGFFALIGLVLAAIGLHGVLSHAVVTRTREIGIRLALGARQLLVVKSVMSETAGALLAGAVCGLAGALYLSRFVRALLFEITPLDFWSLALPLAALLLASLLAAALPAVRVTRVDPVIALRHE